ncbi:MAG: hypothetical protein KDJ99_22125 [Candidatus Competibacteraceae bacterium]|nr:hypothetical protein [Candidatus Competibacteraceae bacterium]
MKDISHYPVMPRQCPTCPFNTDAKGRYRDPALIAKLMQQVLSSASQICHHPRLDGKQETHICRGARDFQLKILHQTGLLNAPTDEAWQQAGERKISIDR